MDSKTIEMPLSRQEDDADWQRIRMEVEQQWHKALTDANADVVPSKLPISLAPVRHAA